jgi:hypothetical protein
MPDFRRKKSLKSTKITATTGPFYHAAPAKTKANLGRTVGSLRFQTLEKVC